MPVNPLLMKVFQLAVKPAGMWLLKQLGADWVLKRIEEATDRILARQHAIQKARMTIDGRFGPALVEGGLHYVVYHGEKPIDIFPPVKGKLEELMVGYDTSTLRDPIGISSARFRAWASGRFADLRARIKRGDEPEPVVTAEEVREGADEPRIEGVREAVGRRAFDAMINQMPTLLKQLTGAPKKTVAAHNGIPETPGIYLFSEGPTPVYVGNTRNLRQRLRQHTSASSRENQAALAWRLALKEARRRGIKVDGTRKQVESDPVFAELFGEMRVRVGAMNAQFVEIDDPITRTVFEVYAANALETDEFNSFETH